MPVGTVRKEAVGMCWWGAVGGSKRKPGGFSCSDAENSCPANRATPSSCHLAAPSPPPPTLALGSGLQPSRAWGRWRMEGQLAAWRDGATRKAQVQRPRLLASVPQVLPDHIIHLCGLSSASPGSPPPLTPLAPAASGPLH